MQYFNINVLCVFYCIFEVIDKARDTQCDEPHKIERVILDNVEKKQKRKTHNTMYITSLLWTLARNNMF